MKYYYDHKHLWRDDEFLERRRELEEEREYEQMLKLGAFSDEAIDHYYSAVPDHLEFHVAADGVLMYGEMTYPDCHRPIPMIVDRETRLSAQAPSLIRKALADMNVDYATKWRFLNIRYNSYLRRILGLENGSSVHSFPTARFYDRDGYVRIILPKILKLIETGRILDPDDVEIHTLLYMRDEEKRYKHAAANVERAVERLKHELVYAYPADTSASEKMCRSQFCENLEDELAVTLAMVQYCKPEIGGSDTDYYQVLRFHIPASERHKLVLINRFAERRSNGIDWKRSFIESDDFQPWCYYDNYQEFSGFLNYWTSADTTLGERVELKTIDITLVVEHMVATLVRTGYRVHEYGMRRSREFKYVTDGERKKMLQEDVAIMTNRELELLVKLVRLVDIRIGHIELLRRMRKRSMTLPNPAAIKARSTKNYYDFPIVYGELMREVIDAITIDVANAEFMASKRRKASRIEFDVESGQYILPTVQFIDHMRELKHITDLIISTTVDANMVRGNVDIEVTDASAGAIYNRLQTILHDKKKATITVYWAGYGELTFHGAVADFITRYRKSGDQ